MKIFSLIICLSLLVVVFTPLSFGEVDSPKKQLHDGVMPGKIICNENLVLVLRPSGMPACVKASTAENFASHGWKKITLNVQQSNTVNQKAAADSNKVTFEDKIDSVGVQNPSIPTSNQIKAVPAEAGAIINFYISDDDLNLAHSGVETISTDGIVQFTINGIPIEGPKTMIETGPDTGEFYLQLRLPGTINGKPINQNDIVIMKYFDASDATGEPRTIEKSTRLSNTYAQIQVTDQRKVIGHDFTIQFYEPDANLDSKDVDRIPLSRFEFRGEGGIRAPLTDPGFDANSNYLLETSDNSNIFTVTIKIPRFLDGKVINIGDTFEIRYIDTSTPSNTPEKIIYKGKIG